MKNVKEKKLVLEVVRTNGKSYLKYSIPSVVTDCYKSLSKGVKVSSSWYDEATPLEYYDCSELRTEERYKEELLMSNLCDDFGNKLIDDYGRFNIAIVRSVNGRGKIQIPNYSDIYSITNGIKNAVSFLKSFLAKRIQKTHITSTLTIDI